MIWRAGLLSLILYVIGFVLFAVTLARPADEEKTTDAIIAITGGGGRIEHGIDLLAAGKGERMLIAGADPSVRKPDLVERLGGQRRLVDCCVDLGSESVDTRSNAEEGRRWLEKNDYDSVRLVTSDWHMRRAGYEFRRELGSDFVILEDAVGTEPSFSTLFGEYNKYLLRRVAAWLGL